MSVNKEASLLTDDLGRTARYLRLSVTDRCNLRCLYCQSDAMHTFIAHENVLRYEEMLCVVGAAVGIGIKKIRLTGGEPFARKGFMSFVEMLRQKFPEVDLRITTNATLVLPHVKALQACGVRGINISLDSFDKETFAHITRKDILHEVIQGIEALLDAGIRIKINAVAMRGITDKELPVFIDFAKKNPVDVRFIEFMPMGSDTSWSDMKFISAEELLQKSAQFADLTEVSPPSNDAKCQVYNGPARMYNIASGRGRVGFITAMSNHFCQSCNRLRVTSDGFVRTCLFADDEYGLRGILRSERINNERKEYLLRQVMLLATKSKPVGEALLKAKQATAVAKKNMVSIGG